MFSAVSDDAFGRFCAVAGRDDLATDARFATEPARAEHREELEATLIDVFATRAAKEWETTLLDVGVGCVRADVMSHFTFLYEDAQAQAIDMMTEAVHPSLSGTYSRYAPVIQLSETPTQAGTFCEKGEHTRALLAELGYTDDEVRRLHDDAVVAWTEVAAIAAAE
jgi:crotonobetainyl-CoA:carnitine CoA-transferase CaiB-like acyl-CoA transferase